MDIDWTKLAQGLEAVLQPLIQMEVAKAIAQLPKDSASKNIIPLLSKAPRTLNYSATHKLYGIGRDEWNRLINSGEMVATSRRMRGGRNGWVVSTEEAKKVLGG